MSNVLRNPLVLPEDVVIVQVADLPDDVRDKLGDGGEEFAITRPLAREPSKLIDAAAARLMEQFRQPRTIVQAVLSYSRAHEADPETTLEESLPLLRQMLTSGLLLPEGAEETRRIEATYPTGSEAGAFRIVRCIQTLDDSELYLVRDGDGNFAALKIARKERAVQVRSRLDTERLALERLDGAVSPRLIEHGVLEERPFLVTQWIAGADVFAAAADLREPSKRDELIACLTNVARAYAKIHARGVLHGDVHPGNILVGRDQTATLIDFGLAHIWGRSADAHLRGGIGFFMEPEYACAMLEQRSPPPATALGEQFAVAALLYMAATGQHYMDFTLQQEEMFEQISKARPLTFGERGVEPWPELEAMLARALAIAPSDRFADMASFAEALANIRVCPRAPTVLTRRSDETLNGMLAHIGLDGSLYREKPSAGPICSVNFGASGIAYALYRFACVRDDPRLLAAADAWIMKAQGEADSEFAFYNPAMEMTEATIGRVSLYHARPGVHLVHAILAHARGEYGMRDAAARGYLASIDVPCLERDLTLGRSGTVLGCATLLEILPTMSALAQDIRASGQRGLDDLWAETAAFDAIARGNPWPNLGIAHGWAGLVYLTLRWHELLGTPIPSVAHDRLDQVMNAASPTGRGLTWPWRQRVNDDGLASMPGWCNGSAGMTQMLCLAHRILGEDRMLTMAETAAWHAWEAGPGPVDLCCGYAGRAYALLDLHGSTGNGQWLARAQTLADRAIEVAPHMRGPDHPRHSLYKGELGLALLLADLEQPQNAVMPMFGSERWR